MHAPNAEMEEAKAAHRLLLDTVGKISDEQARAPSLLEGWTVGHVLTHLARNADGHVGQFEAAARGEAAQQYPGGPAQRARDIETGAGRAAATLFADLAGAIGRLEKAWAELPDSVWRDGKGLWGDLARPMPELVYRRWREVVVHHADLGLAYRPADWPAGFADQEMQRLVAGLADRLPSGTRLRLEAIDTGEHRLVPGAGAARHLVAADKRRLLAWLLGRLADPRMPVIEPWE